MNVLKLVLLVFFVGVMTYATSDLPYRGENGNLMHAETSVTNTTVIGNYFIKNAYRDAKTPNMVTVVLGDYRSIDTFGEQIVIFTAGLITLLILRKRRKIL